jgi:demethylmenaquinone methyltransferase / 2-methoxy-6-polyprenyl-1,4-benzoquinol methylase
MFGRIARRYDLMNTLMTLGQDAGWRTQVADALCDLPPNAHVLDVGSGTGRLAEAIQNRVGAPVVATDFTLPMLELASRRLQRAAADALNLPFGDAEFDAVVSAFVVRNLADLGRGIAEQVRVLRPGGSLAILETTPGPSVWPLSSLFRFYFRGLVPLVGGIVAGDASAYTYLPESTLRFVEPAHLAEVLVQHGLADVHIRRFALGTVALTVGRKRRYASGRSN